eukprot:2126343-Amphidinium_carterae.1
MEIAQGEDGQRHPAERKVAMATPRTRKKERKSSCLNPKRNDSRVALYLPQHAKCEKSPRRTMKSKRTQNMQGNMNLATLCILPAVDT